MAIPIKFRKSSEAAIASYSYTDIAEGTGIVVFYLMNDNTGGTDDYLLTSNIIYSNDIYSSGTTNQEGSYAQVLDLDFDVTFNLPKRVKGDIKIAIPFGMVTPGTGTTFNTYAVVKARHWDGTTETELGSATTEGFQEGISTTNSVLKVVKIPVSLTYFKKGETLRITVEMWGVRAANGGAVFTCYFGHDPKDRASGTLFTTAGTSATEAHVPFVLDL